jgi:hypothetical protein
MEEREWQIMLAQFIESGVVVKNEVINIDSDLILLVIIPWHIHHFMTHSRCVCCGAIFVQLVVEQLTLAVVLRCVTLVLVLEA